MKRPGQIVLFRFPQTDLAAGKLRPALLMARLPGRHDDWLICMISSQVSQTIPDFDDVVDATDIDFADSGLKTASVIRVGRLAVVDGTVLLGAIGQIGEERLNRVKGPLIKWLQHA